ncbi:MAG: glycosyltransferase family 4 protein [Pseudomonadota bacterium]
MRLLCISSHADTRNSVRPEAESFIGLQRAGVEVHVLTQHDSAYAEELRAAGVNLIHQQLRKKFSWKDMREIRRITREHRIDAVYAFNNKAICNAAFACVGLPVVMITYRGQTGNIYRHDPAAYLTHLHPRVDAIVGVSQSVVDDLKPRVRHSVTVERIYKGHDLSWYTEPATPRSALGLASSDFVVGCVANNRPRKGVKYLIEACAKLTDLNNLKLVLIGSGMDNAHLGAELAQAGIDKQTLTLGLRTDATSLIQACDVAVLPAVRREGLPKTVIEAMAYGVPNIVTDTGGNAELVAHQISGLVVPVADSQALATAIRQLHADPESAAQMGKNGRNRIETDFHVSSTVKQTHALLERLVSIRQASATPG